MRKLCRNWNILSPGKDTVVGISVDDDGVIEVDVVLEVKVVAVDTVRQAWFTTLSTYSARTSKSATNM